MKKIVWLFSFFFIALSFVTTAQVNVLPGFQRFKPVNGNPLDLYRQGYSQQSANRLANTRIIIDYGYSNADNDTNNAGFINEHFATADSFNDRYIIQTYDSLHDAISNTGYKYSDFDSVRVDSIIFNIGHENNDGLSDTLITKLVQLTAAGFPTATVLWSDTFTSGANSFTGVNNWLMVVPRLIAPKITLPSTVKFGLKLEYYGAKTDTFGYTYSFVNTGNCPSAGLNFKSALSHFYPNSFHYMTAPFSREFPNAIQGDIGFDCDGDNVPETPYPLQNINFIAILKGIQAAGPAGPKIRLLRVNPVTDEVTIKNFGNLAQDITTYRLCSHITYTNNLSAETILAGSLNLNPGDTVKLKLTSINPNAAGDDLGLYMNSLGFGDPANMLDFTQWKSGGHGRESVAVAKGIWSTGDFMSGNEPYRYTGDGFQDGVYYWRGVFTNCDTTTNYHLQTDTLTLPPAGGGGYISGSNTFGDLSKAEFFSNTSEGEVKGAYLAFAVAQDAAPASTIEVGVWDDSGTSYSGVAGAPGNMLTSETVNISDIAQDIADTLLTYVEFSTPAHVFGNYYVGIRLPQDTNDVVALFTSHDRAPNTGWEQYITGEWDSYINGWTINNGFSNFIYAITCTAASTCSAITVTTTPTNAICTSVNGAASASATGGAVPYTYQWTGNRSGASISGLAAGTYSVTATDANGCTGTANVIIGVTNTTINLVVTHSNNSSCVAPNGTANVVATGGAIPYSYVWSGGNGTTASISNLAAATYTVSVYDANGCSASGSTTVASSLPTIMVNTTNPAINTQCVNPNGTATAVGSGGTAPYTYQWDTAANNQTAATATNLAGGNYSVTATDAAGCTGTGNIIVGTTTPTITISVSANIPNTSCAAPDGSATVFGNGGANPYTYQWDAAAGNQTGPTATNLAGGTYSVTATDNGGCTGSGTVTITSTTPVIDITLVTSTANSNCTNPNGDASISVTGGTGPYTELWSNSLTGTSVTGLANGTYYVTATDANSCTGKDTITIADNRPALSIPPISTSPVTSCVNSNGSATATVNGATGTVSYIWSTSPAQTTPMASNLAAGNYTVSAQDVSSGCTVSGSASIGTNIPALFVSTSSSNNTRCDSPNGTATAIATGGAGGFTYVWSTVPPQTNFTASSLTGGSYTVVVTSTVNGCTASATASLTDSLATVTVDVITTNATSCDDSSGSAVAVATGSSGYTYEWNTAATTSTINNLTSGVYAVTVTDANGCEGSDTATVGSTTLTPPTVTATAVNETSGPANNGRIITSVSGGAAPFLYAWSTVPPQTNDTATNLDAGTYGVTVTDVNGCTASASATVETDVGIKLPADVSSLSVFPNPTTDVVNIHMALKEAKSVKIEWFNVVGEAVIVREFTNVHAVTEKFSLGAWPEGIYLARITVGSESVTSRVTVVR